MRTVKMMNKAVGPAAGKATAKAASKSASKAAKRVGSGRSAGRASEPEPDGGPHTIDWELRLGFLIHDVSRLRRSAFDRCLKPLNVTRSQWWVLAYLSREDGMTQSQLAEELDLGKVAVGGLIDRLQKGGLVRRDADGADRRVNRVFLEPKSKALVNRMRKVSHRMNEQILAGIADAKLEASASALDAMKRNILAFLQQAPA